MRCFCFSVVVIRCQARQRLEQRVELLLIGVLPHATAGADAGNSAGADVDESSNTPEVTDGKNSFDVILF